MTSRDVVVQESVSRTPAEVVENATTQAKLLMNIVEQTNCYQQIQGKKYLQVEAWETIGAFNSTHSETESIEPIMKDNEVIGYKARVQLWKNGNIVGGAVMPCFFTENCCKGKEGDAKHKACMSAAQTFATSKAYRMNFSYVAILAGFQPTPAEEMSPDDKPLDTSHWCDIHNVAFERREGKDGKVWYSHKTEDGKWCNERDIAPEATVKPKEATETTKGSTTTDTPKTKQDLMTWVYTHKFLKVPSTGQVAKWLGYEKIEEIPDNPTDIAGFYNAIKELQSWNS